ncbi:hypothetical protein [Sphingomonas sp. LM7]|uniref:hypothetical protein n=1 Tax=Sphingomonas sp. LM7 TaxID=1938607 RepID=UPI000983C046|nr:hypothetical protein [Sphingomonas sp. LM7]AQR73856.1 hypothetical protein BXU08_09535 [Sphingomonas sp. LM7]
MPAIRSIAFAALILTVALAIAAFFDEEFRGDSGVLLVLFVAAANAGAVAKLASVGHVGIASAGLWFILLSALLALAAVSCSYWVGVVLPSDDSLSGNLNRFFFLAFLVERLLWAGLAALTIGWMFWVAAWFAARRTERVVSSSRRPI